jgi:SAM-dependent methyltransferase
MESDDEALRLDLKTDKDEVETQARWAGLKPGMRVADLGCGPGKTSYLLNQLNKPGGQTIGIDFAEQRVQYAKEHYVDPGLEFLLKDIRQPIDNIGMFDFIWIRFVLEYYRTKSFDILKHIMTVLKPGGIICLIDLDHNCLNHFGMSPRLEKATYGIMQALEMNADFDPYIGRKLYAYLYDLGCQGINVRLDPYHLIFGELKEVEAFNWIKKVEIAGKKAGYHFDDYENGYEEFFEEFKRFFSNPRRFTYTPVICCKGIKPKN